jgi:hypothetical protein
MLACFDNSSNHGAYAPNALLTRDLNVSDGGKNNNPVMKDGFYYNTAGVKITQSMKVTTRRATGNAASGSLRINTVYEQKGLERILTERGLFQKGMVKDQMVNILNEQEDFKSQEGWLKEIGTAAGHIVDFFPKFHCEFNWIERYWGNAKMYARKNCDYSLQGLRNTVPVALNRIDVLTMRKFARKSWRYMDAYRPRSGFVITPRLAEWNVKKYSSHRSIKKFLSDGEDIRVDSDDEL